MKLKINNTVFLCIDMQSKLLPVIINHEEVLRINKLWFTIAKELKLPIFITEQYPKGLGHTVPDLPIEDPNVQIFEKMTFGGPPAQLKKALEISGRRQIIITGIEAHICVFQMSRDLQALGYEVYVIMDGVGSRTSANMKNGLELIRACGNVVINTESALFDLLECAGTEEFKVLSPLIK